MLSFLMRPENPFLGAVECSDSDAQRAYRTLKESGWTAEIIKDAMNLAVNFLRMRNKAALWAGPPAMQVCERGTPHEYAVIRYPLKTTSAEAADLAWKLTEVVVEKGLDKPGLVLSFASVPQKHGAAA